MAQSHIGCFEGPTPHSLVVLKAQSYTGGFEGTLPHWWF
jgi:hypothetical protein